MSDVFYCYSPTLKKELMENAKQRYIARSINPSTNREYWMFLYTDELIDYLNKRPKTEHKYVKNKKNPKFENIENTSCKNTEVKK